MHHKARGDVAPHVVHVLEHLLEGLDPPADPVVVRRPRPAAGGVLDGPLVFHGGAHAVPTIRCEHRCEAPGASPASGTGASDQFPVVLPKSSSEIDGVTVVRSVRGVMHDVAVVGHRVRNTLFLRTALTNGEGFLSDLFSLDQGLADEAVTLLWTTRLSHEVRVAMVGQEQQLSLVQGGGEQSSRTRMPLQRVRALRERFPTHTESDLRVSFGERFEGEEHFFLLLDLVAQLVERTAVNREVFGSNPDEVVSFFQKIHKIV